MSGIFRATVVRSSVPSIHWFSPHEAVQAMIERGGLVSGLR
jgi:hypothetical protein